MKQAVLINSFRPVVSEKRIEVLDALRGLSILGILIANIQFFSGNALMPVFMSEQSAFVNKIAQFLICFFVLGKFYSVFSFLFGFGFALQIARAKERGDIKASFFKRRLFWMLVIGLLHAYLIWAGDILSIYAVTGFFLILFRNRQDKTLLKWAFGLLAFPILSYALVYVLSAAFASTETAIQPGVEKQTAEWNGLVNILGQGTFLQILDFNVRGLMPFRYVGLFMEMRLPKILAMFLLGVYAYRCGLFNNIAAHKDFIRRVMLRGFILGVTGNALLAVLLLIDVRSTTPSLSGLAATVAYAFGVPAMALFYIALIVTLWQTRNALRGLLSHLVPVGRMALTNYLLQTLISVSIFYGYGAGQFGKHGVASATLIAFIIFFLQIPFSALWLNYFSYGPMEWIWRQLTYRQRLPILRTRHGREIHAT